MLLAQKLGMARKHNIKLKLPGSTKLGVGASSPSGTSRSKLSRSWSTSEKLFLRAVRLLFFLLSERKMGVLFKNQTNASASRNGCDKLILDLLATTAVIVSTTTSSGPLSVTRNAGWGCGIGEDGNSGSTSDEEHSAKFEKPSGLYIDGLQDHSY